MNKFKILGAILIASLCSYKSVDIIPEIQYSNNVVSEPSIFAGGIISTDDNSEFDLTFSTNGLTVYFSRRIPGEKQMIYKSQLQEGQWSSSEIAEFSTSRDETAMITPNGKYVRFDNCRSIARI